MLSTTLLFTIADAAPSNQTINFSARLKNSSGGVVPDGYYNVQFKLYGQESGGSALWTETYSDTNGPSAGQDDRVRIVNGYLSVKLGSLAAFTGVDWSSSLWMTMNIGGTSQVANIESIPWDGEMNPRIQLSAVPYAMNAQLLGGKSADEFLQVGSGVQDAGTDASIAINKTGEGNLVQLQSSGTDVFTLSGSGSITLGSASEQSISVADSTSGSGQNLTLSAGGATDGSSGGTLVLQGGSSGAGAGGSVAIDSGAGNGGNITLGGANANAIDIGNSASTTTVNGLLAANTINTSALDATTATDLTIGGVNATSVTIGTNLTVGAGNTITMVGGATSLRPTSPSEGTVYFDTDTKELLVYADGKWQVLNNGGGSDGKTVTKIVAASNSPQAIKDTADYVTDGTADQVEINAALTAAAGGSVYLAEGLYTANATIMVPNNTSLQGAGNSTVIALADIDTADNLIENSDKSTGSKVRISSLRLDGRRDLNTVGNQHGIYLTGLDNNSSGSVIENVAVERFRTYGIYLQQDVDGLQINDVNLTNNGVAGIDTTGTGVERISMTGLYSTDAVYLGDYSSLTASNISNSTYGETAVKVVGTGVVVSGNYLKHTYLDGVPSVVRIIGSNATITGNTFHVGNSVAGVRMFTTASHASITGNSMIGATGSMGVRAEGADNNVISGNTMKSMGGYGVYLNNSSDNNVVTDNRIHDSGNNAYNRAIYIIDSSSNKISGNSITDTNATTANYAIDLTSPTSANNYISDNTLGTGTINDLGTGTIYANQRDASGKLINRSEGGFGVQGSTGSDVLNVDGTTGSVNIAGTLDTTTATALEIGTSKATSINLNQDTKVQSSTDSATTFQVQNTVGDKLLAVNSLDNRIEIGASDDSGTLLVLDTKTTSGDPAGTNGAMYYNSAAGKFRCFEDGAWKDCVTPLPVSVTLDSDLPLDGMPENISNMSFDLAANTKYHYKFTVTQETDSFNAIGHFGVTLPAGVVSNTWCVTTNSLVDPVGPIRQSPDAYCGMGDADTLMDDQGTAYKYLSTMEGYLETGSNPGKLQLRAATSGIGDVTLKSYGSYGILQIVQ